MGDLRVLTATPHEIATDIAHKRIEYGSILEENPVVLARLKATIFEAARDAITEMSSPTPPADR